MAFVHKRGDLQEEIVLFAVRSGFTVCHLAKLNFNSIPVVFVN